MESSCRICKNEYDEDKYKPFLLSCGDTLCQICINFLKESVRSEEFECPICCGKVKSTNVSIKAAIKKKQISNINNNYSENDELCIYIENYITESKYTLKVKKTMTINQLKEKIIEHEGCSYHFHLSYRNYKRRVLGGFLEMGNETLKFYRIRNYATIYITGLPILGGVIQRK